MPTGVQLEQRPLGLQTVGPAAAQQQAAAMPPPAACAVQQQQQQPLMGWLDLDAGRGQQQQQQQQRGGSAVQPARGSPAAEPPGQVAAAVVPGTLKVRLKISKREGSVERRSSPATAASQQVLQTVRQLGTNPLLSPLPAGWADMVRSSPPRHAAPLQQQQQQAASPPVPMAVLSPPSGKAAPSAVSLFGAAPADGFEHMVCEDGEQAAAAGQLQPTPLGSAAHPEARQTQQRQRSRSATPAADDAGQGTKRPTAAAAAPAGGKQADVRPAKRQRPASGTAAIPGGSSDSHVLACGPSSDVGTATAQQQQRRTMQQQHSQASAVPAATAAEAEAGRADGSRLGMVAALLPALLEPAAAGSALPSSSMVQSLQEEGKKLKKFAEKKMKDGKATHVSSMFLCQVGCGGAAVGGTGCAAASGCALCTSTDTATSPPCRAVSSS